MIQLKPRKEMIEGLNKTKFTIFTSFFFYYFSTILFLQQYSHIYSLVIYIYLYIFICSVFIRIKDDLILILFYLCHECDYKMVIRVIQEKHIKNIHEYMKGGICNNEFNKTSEVDDDKKVYRKNIRI